METRFGEFVFDPKQHVLRKGREPVRISPKAFQLLDLLIAKRPEAVAKQDLYDALWPDTIVDEANLKNLVGEVREALGDSAKHPRFIRTVSRFGYAFADDAAAPGFVLIYGKTVFPLVEGEHVIGRFATADIEIDSPLVSRRHARIVIVRGAATVEDLKSKNGTFLNGERLTVPHALNDGDEIKLAEVIGLRLRMPSAGQSTVTKS